MTTQSKIAISVSTALIVLVGILLILANRDGDDGPKKTVAPGEDSTLVRADSRVIGEPGDSGVEFVEFLDFECEACGAVFPTVEEMREKYAGKVTFVARYFPLPGHFNSGRAARAVESAGRQGKFEEMYKKMYETQTTWAEKQEPMDAVFRGFAEELGLDMARFDADYKSAEVADRVQRDVADGEALDVKGTPTIYIGGELLDLQSLADIPKAIDAALAK